MDRILCTPQGSGSAVMASPVRPPANVNRTLIPAPKQCLAPAWSRNLAVDSIMNGRPAAHSQSSPAPQRRTRCNKPSIGRQQSITRPSCAWARTLVGLNRRRWLLRRGWRRWLTSDAVLREIVARQEELVPGRAFGAVPVGVGEHPACAVGEMLQLIGVGRGRNGGLRDHCRGNGRGAP